MREKMPYNRGGGPDALPRQWGVLIGKGDLLQKNPSGKPDMYFKIKWLVVHRPKPPPRKSGIFS